VEQTFTGHGDRTNEQDAGQPHQDRNKDGYDMQQLLAAKDFIPQIMAEQHS
jgi:hypothetical protein